MGLKKNVSSEEFYIAYYGDDKIPGSKEKARELRKFISSTIRKHFRNFHWTEARYCGMIALWKCMMYYQPEFNQKFNSSLYRFIKWECLSFATTIKVKNTPLQRDLIDKKTNHTLEIMDIMSVLSDEEKDIINKYYLYDMSFLEIGQKKSFSKETAREKFNSAFKKIKISFGVCN